jgi:hypothetical protein
MKINDKVTTNYPAGYSPPILADSAHAYKSWLWKHHCGQVTPEWYEYHCPIPANALQMNAAMYGSSLSWTSLPYPPIS